ncbi:uncharacterized protein LOC8068638 isoform X2 [Sorghum bicolor]|uniref:uncharacterized protein LOC8068638 isoform X2 n=1 Tax=Sorghum bicolor TaxID=4558 RepID=UPI000B4244FB|nr:uncharacterized protein LOC8068638 isoform X2 [Sorghum bicolor]XP_021303155.1 uncharacterized protein LOC8068638 isoform X2 [Sorghum bicolor]|eukprot:XP_021303154.1 uncharacterized protein LOC8068638 isoform X2 [Sorghum bicolor]
MHNGLHRYVSLVETIEKHVWIVSFVVPLIMYGLPKVPTMDSLNFSCSQTGAAALHALSEFHSSSNRTNNYGTSRTCSAGFVALRHARHRCCRSRAKFLLNVGSKRELREAIKLPRVDAGRRDQTSAWRRPYSSSWRQLPSSPLLEDAGDVVHVSADAVICGGEARGQGSIGKVHAFAHAHQETATVVAMKEAGGGDAEKGRRRWREEELHPGVLPLAACHSWSSSTKWPILDAMLSLFSMLASVSLLDGL